MYHHLSGSSDVCKSSGLGWPSKTSPNLMGIGHHTVHRTCPHRKRHGLRSAPLCCKSSRIASMSWTIPRASEGTRSRRDRPVDVDPLGWVGPTRRPTDLVPRRDSGHLPYWPTWGGLEGPCESAGGIWVVVSQGLACCGRELPEVDDHSRMRFSDGFLLVSCHNGFGLAVCTIVRCLGA